MKIALKTFLICLYMLIIFSEGNNADASSPDSVLNVIYSTGLNAFTQSVNLVSGAELKLTIDSLQNISNSPLITANVGHLSKILHGGDFPLFQALNFDVTMPGLDDLYGGAKNFVSLIEKAGRQKNFPPVILTNLMPDTSANLSDPIQKMFKNKSLHEYLVLEKSGFKIGVFAVLGNEVIFKLSQSLGYNFKDPELAAQQASRFLKYHEQVDFIVCLTFSGMSKKPGSRSWTGETQYLGLKAPDIDIIISGGTNTQLTDTLYSENTPVLQASTNNMELNLAEVAINAAGRKIRKLRQIPLDYLVSESNPETNGELGVQSNFPLQNELPASGYGQMLTDAMLWAVNQATNESTDFAFLLNENIRAKPVPDENSLIAQTQLLNSLPNISIPGFETSSVPLVRFLLNGEDLQKVLEVNSSVYPIKGADYFLHFAGLKVRYNTSRIIFNRVIEAKRGGGDSEAHNISFDKTAKYSVVSDWITAQRLQIMHRMTSGFLRISLLNREGTELEKLADATILRAGKTIKLDQAAVDFCKSFPDIDNNNIPDVPENYRNPGMNIEVISSMKPQDFFKNPSIVMVALIIISFLMLIGFAAVVIVLIKRIAAKV
ncbi:MAG: hypothetical protein DWQ05_12990 [Calditrichaeota bacterium]|nr:MAG: hypothetical protein DWQ05_12990 [Calditrichota bacterium]